MRLRKLNLPSLWATFLCGLALVSFPSETVTATQDDDAAMQRWIENYDQNVVEIIQSRCMDCHSGDDPDGGFDLSRFPDGQSAASMPDVWESVGKRIRLNEMPPEGSPQLSDPEKGKFYAWLDSRPQEDLCTKLATDETQAWYRGFVMSRRLTRTEYLNAIESVVGLQVDPQFNVPSDGAGGEGFDTNGDSLFTSPIHIEQYLAIANQLVDRLISDRPIHDLDSPQRWKQARELLLLPVDPGRARATGNLQARAWESTAIESILRRFAWLSWRRPIADQELARLMELYHAGQESSDSWTALKLPLKAVLVSPNFLFVVESEAEAGGVQRLTQHQLATRLALFLWSSAPDAELLQLADRGQLETDQQVIAATRRMLADPRATALGENFGLQWLGLANFLTTAKPDQNLYPEFGPELADDLRQEAIMTISSVFRDNRSLYDLVAADWIYVNRRLAEHYGLEWPAATADDWAPIPVERGERGGVITLGATLVSTSYPRRTSPVLRGRWLLEELLGAKVPPPPAGVPALEESEAGQAASLRERLEVHRKNPECASCHNRMDPLGFGLENFDALGRWRATDQGHAIDASGKLPSGETFDGPGQLKQIVLKRGPDFERHVVRKLLGFALGRQLNKFDDCVIDDCLEGLKENHHQARVVIETIVTSYPFQHRYFKAKAE